MRNKVKIKICGITNEEDARRLINFNIFALGFIIIQKDTPSKIELSLATKIIKDLPLHILSVIGVANLPPQEIIEICQITGADVVQLQRGGSLSDIREIRKKTPKLKIWKTVFTDTEPDMEEISEFERVSDAILIHSREGEWETGFKIAKILEKPFILAGGLNLTNVEKAIRKFKPFALDLIRGLETVPGKKDFEKVEKLMRLVGKI